LIPAYNEENAIAGVVGGLKDVLKASGVEFELLVIDDASEDRTAEMARTAGARVLSHPANMGYGGSLRTGIENAAYDWIATIDADSSYPPEEILKLLPYIPQFDMVIGARKGRHYWGSLIKYPARIFFLAIAQFVVGQRIPDANSGLRIFRRSTVIKMLPRLCRGFSFSTTLTLSFMSGFHFVRFEPIKYTSRTGKSKVRYIRDTLRTLQLMLETIVYYNPIKASLLLAYVPFAGCVAFLVLAIWKWSEVWLLISLFLFCWSLLLLGVGFILYLLAQILPSKTRD